MKLFLTIFIGLISLLTYAQNPDRIRFYYDDAGNQTERSLCINCSTYKTTDDIFKDTWNIENEDLLKFSENDIISYYPNPVKEELYLKWDLVKGNTVSFIEIYSMNGQLINCFKNLEKKVFKTISFQDFPIGTYSVLLFYSSGEQKAITIIKQ